MSIGDGGLGSFLQSISSLPPLPSSNDIMSKYYNSAMQAQQNLQNDQWAQAQAENQAWLRSEPSIHAKAEHLLRLRLAGLDSKFHISPEEFLACHVANGVVYIFFVISGKAGNTQEEIALFPSDKLITQFRLIR